MIRDDAGTSPARACAVCGGDGWRRLPDPGPRSMASDLRVLDAPLGTAACRRCGLVVRQAPPPPSIFERGYTLYAHAPGDPRERARQAAYAAWIAAHVTRPPASVLDVGCGNGSLLLALRDVWPAATLTGCDPSAEAAAAARAAGLDVWPGTLAGREEVRADLVVSVNVVEHTDDPVAFLSAVRQRVAAGGRAAVICPDGSRPGVELLMADHRLSLAPSHLRMLLARSGFAVVAAGAAPPGIGEFQLAIARPGVADAPAAYDDRDVGAAHRYLEDWRALDERLLERIGDGGVVCFGAGEAAGLLRAYAPRTWSRVRACTMDVAARGAMFGDCPIVPLEEVHTAEALLLAVRPDDQLALAGRLAATHPHAVTWYRRFGPGPTVIHPTGVTSYGILEQDGSGDPLAAHAECIRLAGHTVVPGGFSPEQLADLRARLDAVLARQAEEFGGEARLAAIGDALTARCPLAYEAAFLRLAAHDTVLALCRRLLGDYIVLLQQNGVVNPSGDGHTQTAYHRDLPYQHFVSSRPLAISALFCLDPFRAATGATMVLPGSHRVESFPSAAVTARLEAAVEAPAGSFIVFDAMLFHRAGHNVSGAPRRAVNHVYGVPILAQQVSIAPLVADACAADPALARLLGLDAAPAASVRAWRERRLQRTAGSSGRE